MNFQQALPVMTFAFVSAAAISHAQAQENGTSQSQEQGSDTVPAISKWNYETLYEEGGMTAESLLDTEVFGPDDEEIGSVENALINDQNQIAAIIAQVGGLWDIGDTHVLVPWDEVEVNEDGVTIPVREDNVEDYGVFQEEFVTKEDLSYVSQVDDDPTTGSQLWKLTEIVDDYASVGDGVGYGYVDDILFTEEGKIQAVVIEADSAYGGEVEAYPFTGYHYGWHPSYRSYTLPYDEADLDAIKSFDYEEYDGLWD